MNGVPELPDVLCPLRPPKLVQSLLWHTLRGNMEKGTLGNVVWLSQVDKLQSQHTQFGEGSGFWFSCVQAHVLFLSVDQGLLASTKLTFGTK